mmetsp:Transcript_35352/g.63572  ORF Transcript_35352/g.63572 Transcript_35352/m.63572 type:complete len:234 (+) Transcript_35352:553-1254(+)
MTLRVEERAPAASSPRSDRRALPRSARARCLRAAPPVGASARLSRCFLRRPSTSSFFTVSPFASSLSFLSPSLLSILSASSPRLSSPRPFTFGGGSKASSTCLVFSPLGCGGFMERMSTSSRRLVVRTQPRSSACLSRVPRRSKGVWDTFHPGSFLLMRSFTREALNGVCRPSSLNALSTSPRRRSASLWLKTLPLDLAARSALSCSTSSFVANCGFARLAGLLSAFSTSQTS